jgi:hypothetical protein
MHVSEFYATELFRVVVIHYSSNQTPRIQFTLNLGIRHEFAFF